MLLFLYGLPGSGKGTQSDLIKKNFNFYHISTGDLIRDIINNKKEGWEKLNSFVSTGQLVPDDLINEIFFNALNEKGLNNNFIIDGYPRTINQFYLVEQKLKTIIEIRTIHIYIRCDEEKIIKRITSRRVCTSCGAIYNIELDKDIDSCKLCGGKIYQRSDDTFSVISKRIEEYKIKTLPIINKLKELNSLYEVNGDKSVDLVYSNIYIILKENGI